MQFVPPLLVVLDLVFSVAFDFNVIDEIFIQLTKTSNGLRFKVFVVFGHLITPKLIQSSHQIFLAEVS